MGTVAQSALVIWLLAMTLVAGDAPANAQDKAKSVPGAQGLAQQLVSKGRLETGVVACAACHRKTGEGDAGSAFGKLTGLSAEYLIKQLEDYRSGARENRVMQVIARNLSDRDIAALASYYSKLDPSTRAMPIPEAPPIGVQLARHGDDTRGMVACNACHGREARTSTPEVPNLYGQHPLYIVNQLTAWQDGTRHNDPGNVMAEIARRLSVDEINALAIYYARRERGR